MLRSSTKPGPVTSATPRQIQTPRQAAPIPRILSVRIPSPLPRYLDISEYILRIVSKIHG